MADIDLFRVNQEKDYKCKCGHKVLEAGIDRGELILKIDCIACEKQHTYKFKLLSAVKQPINIISCKSADMEIAFMGDAYCVDGFIRQRVYDTVELLKSLGVM